MKKYTVNHLWVTPQGNDYKVGISAYLNQHIGPIENIDLPNENTTLQSGELLALLESKKAAIELEMPFSGTITKINENIAKTPSILNTHPETKGLICLIDMHDKEEVQSLLEENAYLKSIHD